MRNRKTKNSKERLCVVGMVLLVIAALFLPRIIFEIQDKYRLANTEVEARESLDISQLNLSYEEQLGTRMSNFLKANQPMVTGLDYEVTEGSEQAKLLETIMYQEWFYILSDYSLNMGVEYYGKIFNTNIGSCVQDCRKYIVYGDKYKPLLMMWYFDIELTEIGIRMQFAVDSETDTIYYMKMSYEEQQFDKAGYVGEEVYYYLFEYIQQYMYFYYSYYEADDKTDAEYAAEKSMLNEAVSVSDETVSVSVQTFWEQYDAWVEMDDAQYNIKMPLPYGEAALTFLFRVEWEEGVYPDITVGVEEIGELIPEMMQD